MEEKDPWLDEPLTEEKVKVQLLKGEKFSESVRDAFKDTVTPTTEDLQTRLR